MNYPALRYVNMSLLCAATVVLIGMHQHAAGWALLLLSATTLLVSPKDYAKDALLIHFSVAILGITPITTDISYSHMIVMGATLSAAVALPLLISRYIYKNDHVVFKFHHGRRWYKKEFLYVFIAGLIAYFLIPFYLLNTSAYLNWPAEADTASIIRLFIGTNALGIWDELFFICTVLGLLRHHFSFAWANVFQAIMFTSFLYELGFTGWGPVMIFIFALSQGYIFKKTESLFYVISIHLTVDFILFLALINAHHPSLANVFWP